MTTTSHNDDPKRQPEIPGPMPEPQPEVYPAKSPEIELPQQPGPTPIDPRAHIK